MCNLFSKHEDQIERYCVENKLDFEKAKKLPKSYGKNDVWLQYHDPEKGKAGLRDETLAPIVLKIFIENDKITFEQTEYTKKYLKVDS